MLFLHALLFSLLGTSALAIPVPFGHTSGAVAAGSTAFGVEELLINHELKKKINGLWRSQVPEVSQHRSFYSHPVLNLDNRILHLHPKCSKSATEN